MTETETKKVTKEATKKAPAKAATKTVAKKEVENVISEEFAVIETGGKQYIVSVGDVLDVELIGEHEEGVKVEFDKVLMTDDGKNTTIGTPYIDGAKVKATYKGLKKAKKLSIVRFEAKSTRHRKIGHRQKYSTVQIDSIK